MESNFNLSIDPHSPCVAGPVVDELQGNTCSTTVTFRNEKHGKHRSCEALREHFNRSNFRGLSTTISVTDDFFGLTPLFGEADAPVQYVPWTRYQGNQELISFVVAYTSSMASEAMPSIPGHLM